MKARLLSFSNLPYRDKVTSVKAESCFGENLEGSRYRWGCLGPRQTDDRAWAPFLPGTRGPFDSGVKHVHHCRAPSGEQKGQQQSTSRGLDKRQGGDALVGHLSQVTARGTQQGDQSRRK